MTTFNAGGYRAGVGNWYVFPYGFNFWNNTDSQIDLTLTGLLQMLGFAIPASEVFTLLNANYGYWDVYTSPYIVPDSELQGGSGYIEMNYEISSYLDLSSVAISPGGTVSIQGHYMYDYEKMPAISNLTPIFTINGEQAVVKMSGETFIGATNQYVNILGENGFITNTDTSKQNTVTGNGIQIQLGGAGGNLNTGNISFQIYASGTVSVGTDDPETLNGRDVIDHIEAWGGDDIVYAGGGNDSVAGGEGNDTIYAGTGNDIVGGQSGDDLLHGDEGDDWLDGDAGTDTLKGGAGNDRLLGGAGDDLLDGGSGADTMWGGTGDDTYIAADLADRVIEASDAGIDHVRASVTFSLAGQHIEDLTLTGTNAISGTGNSLANQIMGNSAVNRLTGGSGNDTLSARGGADTLDGGTGADSMVGGKGDDTYVVDNLGDRVIEASNAGLDHVRASVAFSLAGQHIENLTLTGTHAISGTGNSLANGIMGNSASNRLSGETGDDTLTGGGGRDVLTGGTGADVFRYLALSDSGIMLNRADQVMDFTGAQGDRIDLSALDADSTLGGDQAFSFIESADFGIDATGQLRFDFDAELNVTMLYASTDADYGPEFAVLLRGVSSLSAGDFIL